MTFDIAIVGGGTAAAAATLALEEGGHSLVRIAPAWEPEQVGESLSASAHRLLAQLRLSEAFESGPHRPSRVTYSCWDRNWLGQRCDIAQPEGPGYVLDRPAFADMLARAADRWGAARARSSLVRADRSGGLWCLGLTDGSEVRARFALDCSGRRSVVGGRQASRRRLDRMVAVYDFLPPLEEDVEPTPATLIEAVEHGWWYTALLPDLRMGLYFMSDPDLLPPGLARDPAVWRQMATQTRFVQPWLDSAGYRIDRSPRLTSAATTWLQAAAGPDWAAAGDAAACLDPLSSHGLASALWGGWAAAAAARSALEGDSLALESYSDRVTKGVRAFLEERQRVYSRPQRFQGQPFWVRRGTPETAWGASL